MPGIVIDSGELQAAINPHVGGTITSIRHLSSGLEVLGRVPWDAVDEPIASFGARDEFHWLTRYAGGWPVLFPNGGDACAVDGVFHGFHGEASIAPWEHEATPASIKLTRYFYSVPVVMEREIAVEGETLTVNERIRMEGASPIEVMWGHHPTFGSDLLAGPVEITTSGKKVMSDDAFDPPASPLVPGVTGTWPRMPGKSGAYNLSKPAGAISAAAYLSDFGQAWIAMRRLDDAIAISLAWDEKVFPCCWVWYELGGTAEAPWYGRGNVIGLEPNTTQPGQGLAKAKARGSHLLRLEPGADIRTSLACRVFKPSGPITSP